MSKFLLVLALFVLSITVSAQSLRLSDSTGQLANNDTIVKYGGDISIDVHAFISNKSLNDLNVMLKKTLLQVMPGSTNYYCWGVCYPADSFVSTYPVFIQAQQTDFLNFTGHYICQGNPGTAYIRYTFFNQQDPTDSVCVNVEFHACLISGLDQQNEQATLQPYPNPAAEVFNYPYSLTIDQEGESYFELRDMQGSLLQRLQLRGKEGEATVNVKDYASGMYYCSFVCRGVRQYTRKIIVQ